ncbi:MAG: CxxC-x17-CxxC domain-containing protein [Patescibacteria group bacterium]|nr:hypothetical protein [Patescibacteria group bacterium]MBU1876765.1 hypothetical protein [Patescibacteria group bacterium]
MKNFGNTYRGDFKGGGYGKRQFGNRDRERPQMHEAICSDCGKKCEVPFRPTGDKPVYCSQCFTSHRGSSTSNNSERRGYEKPRFQDNKDRAVNQYKEQFEMLNTKLDSIIKILTPVIPVKEEKKVVVKKKKR